MLSLRNIIIGLVGLCALAAGIIFAMPVSSLELARVDLGSTSLSAEVVRSMLQKMKGLGDRASLPEFSGMLFVMGEGESGSIWMKDMHFAIDIFWIRNGTVVDLQENAPAPAAGTPDSQLSVYQPDSLADLILETSAGFAKKHGIVIGSPAKIFFKDGAIVGTSAGASAAGVSEYSIDALRQKPLEGQNLRIEKMREEKNAYTMYQIRYGSDNLEISGVMNVPSGPVPKGGFPAIIMNHGISKPANYITGTGLLREEDFFARSGYVTIHPDYRGYPNSTPNPEAHHDFYVGYTRDVLNVIDALKKHPFEFIDTTRIGMFGQGMGGAIAARVMVLMPEIRAFVLSSPFSASVENNFNQFTSEEIAWLHKTYGEHGSDIYKQISPIEYFKNVSAPIQLHHGSNDTEASVDFSKQMRNVLQTNQKSSELFLYEGEGHDLGEEWPVAMGRSLQFFNYYIKK